MSRTCSFLALLLCALGPTSVAQKKATEVPAAVIMQNVEKGFEGVQDFVATVEVAVDMDRVRVPKMTATMYFKKPDKIHFSSTSFAMLPREGIVLNPSLLRQRYDPVLVGEDTLDGEMVYKLRLTAKDKRVRAGQLLLWIDPGVWTIVRMETVPYQGRVLRLAFTNALQDGKYWLPQTLKASFELAARDTTARQAEQQFDPDMQAPQQGREFQRPPRAGSITVRYLDYKINVGLSDDMFENREAGVKPR